MSTNAEGTGECPLCGEWLPFSELVPHVDTCGDAGNVVTTADGKRGFAVHPKTDCPHLDEHFASPDGHEIAMRACSVCDEDVENWLCLSCYDAFCSRYRPGRHMSRHTADAGHAVCLSLADLSVWCFSCSSYVTHPSLQPIIMAAHMAKFGHAPGAERGDDGDDDGASEPSGLSLEQLRLASGQALQVRGDREVNVETDWQLPGNSTPTPQWLEEHAVVNGVMGVLWGAALGDAVGLATEFLRPEDVQLLYGDGHIPFPRFVRNLHNVRWTLGDWTDDTDQMALIMESLCEHGGQANALDFATRLKQWALHGIPSLGDTGGCGLGMTTAKVLSHPAYGIAPGDAAAEAIWWSSGKRAAPNGAIMRNAAIGCHRFADVEEVKRNAVTFARVTHVDPRCTASCIMHGLIVARLLQARLAGTALDDARVVAIVDQCGAEARATLRDEHHVHQWDALVASRPTLAQLQLGEQESIGFTLKCLGAAVWALCSGKSYTDAIEAITMQGGDADTNAIAAGALLGARWGYGALPRQWLAGLAPKPKQWLHELVVRFMALNGLSL